MPSADLLLPFFLASAIFACVPGPGMFFAAAQTLAAGRRAGWWSALGLHIAGLGHVAAAVGTSTLLAVMPQLFTAMKLAGAVYLVWLGIGYLMTPRSAVSSAPGAPTVRRALRDSIVTEAVNPKSALFYLVFLPQFTDASADLPVWIQVIVLGTIVNALFSAIDAILIALSHALSLRLRSSDRLMLALRRVGGGVFVLIGLNLALAGDR